MLNMPSFIPHTIYTQDLTQGVDTCAIPCLTEISATEQYRHGQVFDILIVNNLQQSFTLPSKQLVKFLTLWGLPIIWEGELIVHQYRSNKTFAFDRIYNKPVIEVSSDYTILKYRANSREIFKPIHAIKKTLQTALTMDPKINLRHITPKYSNEYRRMTINLALSLCLFKDPIEVVQYLQTKHIRFNSIINIIDKPKFKHCFKLLHPDTEFYI